MSETPPEATETATTETRTFSQEDVDRIIADRLKREDVKGLKAKAAQVDESKSETQRLAEQIAELTRAQAQAQAQALRYRIAAQQGISNEDADLFLTGADEDTISAQAKRLAERDSARKAKGNYVPNEGRTPADAPKSPWSGVLSELTSRRQS